MTFSERRAIAQEKKLRALRADPERFAAWSEARNARAARFLARQAAVRQAAAEKATAKAPAVKLPVTVPPVTAPRTSRRERRHARKATTAKGSDDGPPRELRPFVEALADLLLTDLIRRPA